MSEKRQYTKTEKVLKSIENNTKHIEGCNAQYWNDFEQNSHKAEHSMPQYKSAIRRYIEHINKDILESSVDDLNAYLEKFEEGKTRINQQRYIQSFIIFTISNNFDKARSIVSNELVVNLIPSEYKDLIKLFI